MSLNNFLAFCPTDTGTNLLDQTDYAAAADRTSGNKPGIASARLNNKALRQANYITSQFAQFLADLTGADILDDNTPAKLLAQINASLKAIPPALTKYTSGSGTHVLTYYFFIATGSATAAATYTNNAITFTVKDTVASGTLIAMTGSGAPLVSGTLTKASGTGDSTLTFYAVRRPISLNVKMVGGGGGGAGGGATGGVGGTGGNTTFGTTLLVANGGTGGTNGGGSGGGGTGGTASLGTGPVGVAVSGGTGNAASNVAPNAAGAGGAGTPFGGGGGAGWVGEAGIAGATNTGAGGGGAGSSTTNAPGSGGSAGGFVDAIINTVLATYAYAVGAAGAAGAAGTLSGAGGAGGSGVIVVTENYQ